MVNELKTLLGTSKTEAVRRALMESIRRAKQSKKPSERLAPVIAAAQKLPGETDPVFDMKEFTDEMWGDA
jgi:hypothetical protein